MPWKSRFSIVFLWFIRAKKASTARRLECDGEAPSPRVWHCACQAVHGQWPLGTLGTFFQQRKGAKPPWNQPTNSDFNGISWWFHGILWFNQHGDRKPTKLVIKCIRTYKDNMWYMFFLIWKNINKLTTSHDKSLRRNVLGFIAHGMAMGQAHQSTRFIYGGSTWQFEDRRNRQRMGIDDFIAIWGVLRNAK